MLERKTAGLLAYLALEGPTQRSVVAGLLWPETSEPQARTNLRKVLSTLRKLGPIVEGAKELALTTNVQVDVRSLLEPAADEPTAPEPQAVLLAGLDYDDCPDFAEWLLTWRERLREAQVQRLEKGIEGLEAAGELSAALALAKQLVHLEPLSEASHRRLMRLHYLLGDRAAALAAYHHLQELLARELDLEPLPETVELARQIERMTVTIPSLPRKAIPVSVLRPLLVGREEAWLALEDAWQQNQIIFITGEAGIGKTRLVHDFLASKGTYFTFPARPSEQDIPYASMARNLRSILTQEVREKLEPWVLEELSRVLPELKDKAPPPEHALHFLEASAVVLERVSQDAVAFVSDDLHFWDPASFRLGSYLAGRFSRQGHPMRSLNCFRPSGLSTLL